MDELPQTARLTLRIGGLDEVRRRRALWDLLGKVFELDFGVVEDVGWDPAAVPFTWMDGPIAVANVTAFPMPLVLEGRRVDAWAIQSVATLPAWRGRGLFRDLMGRALKHCDARTDLVLLATATPALYRPFGFRDVVECAFEGPAPNRPAGVRADVRRLLIGDASDRGLVQDLLGRRAPVSHVAAVVRQAALFAINAAWDPAIELLHLPGLDAVVAIERRDGLAPLVLLDVVAPQMPSLATVLAAAGLAPDTLRTCFPPDRIDWPEARAVRDDTGYLVRGPFLDPAIAYMLSPMAAF